MDIHLDLIGGMAGDMFIAAIVHALPQHENVVIRAMQALSHISSVSISFVDHHDSVLTGKRFQVVRALDRSTLALGGAIYACAHAHSTWQSIRTAINESTLDSSTRQHAIGIFSLLAAAESSVHGCEADDVTFHEVGAWDSIADILGAAALIAAVNARRWTASPAPLGAGRVNTAHGILSLPAPATTRLLMGMATIDDGIAGERVTPTGAAILRYLCGPTNVQANWAPQARILSAYGNGFGTRTLPGLSNHLRVMCFDPVETPVMERRRLHIIEFDVDDQSGEELALGLDRLRLYPAVLDITQAPLLGKKNRLATLVRMLVRTDYLDSAIEGCFRETTTIGLRHFLAEGIALKRQMRVVEVDGHSLRVKVVQRPSGRTAKAESDDVLERQDHRSRAQLRGRAEALALAADLTDVDA